MLNVGIHNFGVHEKSRNFFVGSFAAKFWIILHEQFNKVLFAKKKRFNDKLKEKGIVSICTQEESYHQ